MYKRYTTNDCCSAWQSHRDRLRTVAKEVIAAEKRAALNSRKDLVVAPLQQFWQQDVSTIYGLQYYQNHPNNNPT